MTSDLNLDYEQAGFSGRLSFGSSPALVIVDVVRAYTDRRASLYIGAENALASNVRLAEAARARSLPIVFTKVVYDPSGRNGGLFYKKVPALANFSAGSMFADFAEGLEPMAGDLVVEKQYASSFFGTSLASTLAALRVDTVLITGFSTSGCVRATAVDAIQLGFAPFVVEDACGDRDPRPHEASLFDLRSKYAEVVRESEALDLMRTP